jgi:hypothetical protein
LGSSENFVLENKAHIGGGVSRMRASCIRNLPHTALLCDLVFPMLVKTLGKRLKLIPKPDYDCFGKPILKNYLSYFIFTAV